MNEKTSAGKSSFANLPNQITVTRLVLSLGFSSSSGLSDTERIPKQGRSS